MSSRPITKNILSYIENHLDDELSLEKIAEELNYSRFYIARVFRENTGLTLYRYIRGRRLNESARKLTETKLSVIEIAFLAGYHSQQAFTQAFHREYDCTPQEYRRIGVFVPRRDKIEMRVSGKCSFHAIRLAGEEMAA